MTVDLATVSPVENPSVRGGRGSVFSRPLLAPHPGSAIAGLAVNRLPPGASIGLHPHHGEEDFYYCLSGRGIVTDNGEERPFHPGVLQLTRSGGTQALRNPGTEDLVFLGCLVRCPPAPGAA